MRTLLRSFACSLALAVGVAAHDPGLSSCSVTLHPGRTELVLQLANADAAAAVLGLDADHDGVVAPNELAGAEALLRAFVTTGLGNAELVPSSVRYELEPNRDLRITVLLPGVPSLQLDLRWIEFLPRGHREYFVAKDAAGALLHEALLQRGKTSVVIATTGGTAEAHSSFVLLGIEHVLTGYDHVLFLLALLLVTRKIGAALKVITAFTVAHSLTLALATLDVVRLPSTFVETTIALSIVYVGVENLLVKEPRARWRCTFAFGLVHGFGFASVLQELGIADGPRGLRMPLLE